MKVRTIPTACFDHVPRRIALTLVVLLSLVVLGWGQERDTGGRRRTARADLMRTIQLPEPTKSTGVSFEQALLGLSNLAIPSDQRLQPDDIGQLLWAGQGVALQQASNAVTGEPLPAMRLYVSMPDGIYVYYPSAHTLKQTNAGDARGLLASAALSRQAGQAGPVGGCQIVVAGVARDYATRFGNRSRTVMALQAGRMAQSMQLEAVCLDLTFMATASFDAAAVRRACRLTRDLDPLYVLLVGSPASQTTETTQAQSVQGPATRAVLIVPPGGFQDEELFATQRGLQLASVQTVIASTRIGTIVGLAGSVVESELLVNRVSVEDFSAVVFIGGSGTAGLLNNRAVLDLARRAAATNRVVAASGNAPAILASAGVISGAQVTGLLSVRDRLILAGATYTGAPVQRDGPLVTSAGPQVVPQFVMAIVDALSGR